MAKVYHAPVQPSLFPQKQCTKCKRWLENTPQYFYCKNQRTDKLFAECIECYKKKQKETPENISVTLTCDTCGKEFQRRKGLHERTRRHNAQYIFCSRACCRNKGVEWSPTLGEEYLQGATLIDLANKYHLTWAAIRYQLMKQGIPIRAVGNECHQGKPHPMKGKRRPLEIAQKIGDANRQRERTPEARLASSHRAIKRIAEGKISRVSKVETRVAEELTKQGITFTPQYGVTGQNGKFAVSVDFMLADGRAVEINGTYWHADPRKYPDGPIYDAQKKKIASDQKKQRILAELNIPLIVLWEMDLTADMAGTISKALSQ